MDVRVAGGDGLRRAAQLLHDFNTEYDEPTPPVAVLAARLAALDDTDVLLGDDCAVLVLRYQQSLWTEGLECYLAELYVQPGARGRGLGRQLLLAGLQQARSRGADYIHLGTTEDDVAARHLYEAVGFRRTEGDGGPLMFVYEMDLA